MTTPPANTNEAFIQRVDNALAILEADKKFADEVDPEDYDKRTECHMKCDLEDDDENEE